MIPPVQKECPPFYMNSVMKRFGHHLSTDQTHYLTGRMASSLHSAPEGSSCSLPRSIIEDHQQQPIHPNSHQSNSTTNNNALLIPNHHYNIIHTSQMNHTSSSYHDNSNSQSK
ncbi:hypothetical protein INT45_003413 [Circinella minor]|uniref:Uncharacterized protein n=1 Tax=Circinella minor TaxID=1195481 RepID=A0A8H7S5C1_9FUNG|nr:hypothetical protein INT45_003413 [Circinella minor]